MAADQLNAGDIIGGRYKISRFIGEGGMQKVYLAEDTVFGRHVALKTPKNESAEKRFQKSAELSAQVVHPNVAQTIDYLQQADRDFLIEEYIVGADLRQRFQDKFKILDPHLVGHVMLSLARGLAASHHAGVFHRDLKPSNIMVSTDAGITEIKITDFGIAKMASEEIEDAVAGKDGSMEESIEASSTTKGALPYMAPEFFDEDLQVSFAADIWSIGAISYYLMTGKPPFGTGLKVIRKLLKEEKPAKPDVPSGRIQFQPLWNDLWDIVASCLQYDASLRPNADDLVRRCSELCFNSENRIYGKLVEFGSGNGRFGKLRGDDGVERFFHADSYIGANLKVGAVVSFSSYPGTPRQRAHPVLELKG